MSDASPPLGTEPARPVRFAIEHRTEYQYGTAMNDGYTVTHLLPRDTAYQRVESAELFVTPDADEYDENIDMFGNRVVHLGIHHPHQQLGVTARSVVTVQPARVPAVDHAAAISWEDVAATVFAARGAEVLDVGPFAAATSTTPNLAVLVPFVNEAFTPGRPFLEAVRVLCGRIFEDFVFDPGFSDITTPIEAVMAARRGVCQDFAHLALACLRSVGLAGRYVSGYVETAPPPGEAKMVGADASHAWCSTW